MEKVKSTIIFGNEKIELSFNKLKTRDNKLYKSIIRAFIILENNAFAGIQIRKKLIPDKYHKTFGKLDNLWKYNLPNSWRLIYTVKSNQIEVISIILEWMSHKEYERKLKY